MAVKRGIETNSQQKKHNTKLTPFRWRQS